MILQKNKEDKDEIGIHLHLTFRVRFHNTTVFFNTYKVMVHNIFNT